MLVAAAAAASLNLLGRQKPLLGPDHQECPLWKSRLSARPEQGMDVEFI